MLLGACAPSDTGSGITSVPSTGSQSSDVLGPASTPASLDPTAPQHSMPSNTSPPGTLPPGDSTNPEPFSSSSNSSTPTTSVPSTASAGGAGGAPSIPTGNTGGSISEPSPGASSSNTTPLPTSTAPTPGPTGAGGASNPAEPATGVDVFGIKELYPSAPSGALWTSEHWSNAAYSLSERRDPNDPQGLSGMRGSGTLEITGNGELVFGGSQPRIYVYPGDAGPWRDVEVTVYYQRVTDAATAWAGLVIGTRSGPDAHGNENCDAHTYYSRLRHDGAIDFEKELMHSPSSTRNRIEPEEVWPPDGQLPYGVWIGWKFVIYNQQQPNSVKLEAYRDMTDGQDGGDWRLVNEAVDEGGWFTQTSCAEHSPVNGESDMVVVDGGVTFIRNTDVTEARYKKFTVREIQPR